MKINDDFLKSLLEKEKRACVLRGYEEVAKKTGWLYSELYDEIKGFLNGYSAEELIPLWEFIKPCTCGSTNLLAHQDIGMGDGDFMIVCKDCGRMLRRTCYDYDLEGDEVLTCIKDWNNGVEYEEVIAKLEAEKERLKLKPEDLVWKPIYPNNLIHNGEVGLYSLLFKKGTDGNLNGCKWSIIYQYEEESPAVICSDAKINAYNLYIENYDEIVGEHFDYPNPVYNSNDINPKWETITKNTFHNYGVNSFGQFIYSYKTLDEAKNGALGRCGIYGYNTDTIVVK